MGKLLDEGILGQLKEDVGKDVLKMLIQAFIAETESRAELLRDLVHHKNWDALGKEGHTLKSTAGSFGMPHLQFLAKALDESCRRRDYESAEKLAREIPDNVPASLSAMRDWVDRI